jgi:hypothetical protein
MRSFFLASLVLVLGAAAPARAAFTYQWDDGTAERMVGSTADADLIFLDRFDVITGNTVIDNVSVAWGQVPVGRAATIAVWQDPDSTGDPHNAQLLRTVAVTVNHSNTDAYDTYAIPATIVSGTFFVGVDIGAFYDSAAHEYPARFDDDSTLASPKSWIAAALPGQSDLTNLSLPADGTVTPLTSVNLVQGGSLKGYFMIRADAVAPEPASVVLLLLGAGGLMMRRGRKSQISNLKSEIADLKSQI